MRMKNKLLLISMVGVMLLSLQVSNANNIIPFKLQDVKLLPSIFMKAQTTDMKYMMSLNPDRLLSPFLREAG